MNFERLQLKQLSKSGELLGVITCHAGQVSVFRSSSPSELRPYIRALAGIPGAERFAIYVDERPYDPSEHHLIGFGEKFSSGSDDETLRDFFIRSGASEGGVDALCYSFGLEAYLDKKCSALPPSEERIARILAATFSADCALIISDPFEPVSSAWRERLAEHLANFANHKKAIVIVPSLTYRPDYWIDNPRIARIQVGENIQRTIGFGSADKEFGDLVKQVRAEFSEERAEQQTPSRAGKKGGAQEQSCPVTFRPLDSSVASPPGDASTGRKVFGSLQGSSAATGHSTRRTALLGLALIVLLVVIARSFFSSSTGPADTASNITRTPHGQDQQGAAASQTAASSVNVAVLSDNSPLPEGAATTTTQIEAQVAITTELPIIEEVPTQIPEPPKRYVLDLYPSNIRTSLLNSFEGRSAGVASQRAGTEKKSPRISGQQSATHSSAGLQGDRAQNTADDLLSVLESASGQPDSGASGAPVKPTQVSQQDLANMSPEQRREVIRQRFLEAIQRSSQQRENQ